MEDRFEIEPPSRRRWSISTWALLVWAGWIVFEATANELLAAVVVCCKLGWNDLATGWWLRRTDPVKKRGRTCFWFYAASGLWKIGITAVAVALGLGFVIASMNAARWQRFGEIVGAMSLQFIAALLLASLATAIGVWMALVRNVRVWVSRDLHAARRSRAWPLPVLEMAQAGPRRWWTTLFVVLGMVGAGAIFMSVVMIAMMMAFPIPIRAMVAALWAGLLMFGMPVLGLVARDIVVRRVLARWPFECWPEPLFEAVAARGDVVLPEAPERGRIAS